MATVTVRNDFHNTAVNLRLPVVRHIYGVATIYPSVAQIKRAWGELCGIDGCQCGSSNCGTRGQQSFNGERLVVDESSLYERAA